MLKILIDRFYRLSTYQIINSVFIVVIIGIIGYSAMFSPERSNHPIPSSSKLITGEDTVSTGMSRAFSCIMRLRFERARAYNPYSIQVFAFFLIQLIIRIFLNVAYKTLTLHTGPKQTVIIDVIISSVLFIIFFEPFWREMGSLLK